MNKFTRRSLLKIMAMGVAAGSALAAMPGLIDWRHQAADSQKADEVTSTAFSPASEPIMVYVRDASKGEVSLMAGTKEIVRNDPRLVSYLVKCCQAEAT